MLFEHLTLFPLATQLLEEPEPHKRLTHGRRSCDADVAPVITRLHEALLDTALESHWTHGGFIQARRRPPPRT